VQGTGLDVEQIKVLTDARPMPTAGGEWDEHGVGLAGCHSGFSKDEKAPWFQQGAISC
jgi:hypothetical protein